MDTKGLTTQTVIIQYITHVLVMQGVLIAMKGVQQENEIKAVLGYEGQRSKFCIRILPSQQS